MFIALVLMLIGILIIFYGIFTRRKPSFGWRSNEGWKVKGDSEPSESYLEYMKFAGFVAILLGSFFLVCGLLSLWSALAS
ncbi:MULTISPECIES: DUF6199 family natural product biosynthesis protein [Paenibacillus]|uniref:DUF6199 family natural product biosynthesis protein n=1 Tax=Paenibacillus TaxID=44249 RepID=UPI002FDF52FD